MLNQNYKPPSRQTFFCSLLQKIYINTVEKVRKEMNNASIISLTTDGWTSLTSKNYLGITAHFMDKNCSLRSYLLSCCKLQNTFF